jgi:hypothetical protein
MGVGWGWRSTVQSVSGVAAVRFASRRIRVCVVRASINLLLFGS